MTTTELDIDLLTPLAAYLRLRETGRASFLLESVDQGRLGRHSLVGCGDRIVSFEEAEQLGEAVVGYLGYDHIAKLERTVPLPADGPGVDESRFVVADVFLRFDHVTGTAEVLVGDAAEVARCSRATSSRKRSPSSRARRCASRTAPSTSGASRWRRSTSAAATSFKWFCPSVRVRETSVSPLAVYRALRRINPSPYLFLLELDGVALVGSSPETHVKAEASRASLNPIAGTTARGDGDAERLLTSEKDRAEHVMLVDLGRNDLSRVCVPGTVKVERFLEPERFSHVTHLVSEVAGELADGVTPFDLLRATFPAGTVSGAPKVRAMQIISELEGYRRGTYAGVVGYHLPGVGLDTCIAIRTVRLQDGYAYLQAGGGIVADSDPGDEHQECLNKLAALEAAIEAAERR